MRNRPPWWTPRGEPYAVSTNGELELHLVLRAWLPGPWHVTHEEQSEVLTMVVLPFIVLRHRMERSTGA